MQLDIGFHALDQKFLEYPAHAAYRLGAALSVYDKLGDHAVIVRRYGAAGIERGVHPHPEPAGDVEAVYLSRAGAKALAGDFGVDTALD